MLPSTVRACPSSSERESLSWRDVRAIFSSLWIQGIVHRGRRAYWRDVGTVDAFWEANLELAGVTPELNLYDKSWPIWTYQAQLPPAKFILDDDNLRGEAIDSGHHIAEAAIAVESGIIFLSITTTTMMKSRPKI